jgi:hypothetical protein
MHDVALISAIAITGSLEKEDEERLKSRAEKQ